MTRIVLALDGDPKAVEALNGNRELLRSLCRKEVESFDSYLRAEDPQFKDGLAKWEKLVVEGYIYQKLKNHIDTRAEDPADG